MYAHVFVDGESDRAIEDGSVEAVRLLHHRSLAPVSGGKIDNFSVGSRCELPGELPWLPLLGQVVR